MTAAGMPARHGWGLALLGVVALLAVARPAAADITVSATVDSNDVTVGQAFALTITIDGAQNVPLPSLDGLDGFRADYLGPSTQVSFVNGRMSASVSHRYRLIAERPGQFTLGPFTVEYDNQRFQTAAIPMRVAAANAPRPQQVVPPGGVQNLRLVVQPDRDEIYVGERVGVTVTLYIGNIRVRELQYPTFTAEGLTVDKFSKPDEGSEVVDGRRFQTVRLHTTMKPLRPGRLDLQATMGLSVMTNRRGDAFFNQFFGGDAQPTEVRSDSTPITVSPLPDAGRPADFGGAVGQFDFNLSAKPTELDAGDPVTLRMEISGTGDLSAVSAPPVPAGDRFRTYDPQPVKGEDGAERRVFEQVVIPKEAGTEQIPAVRFSYFDPTARAYRTIARGPIALTVRAAAQARGHVLDSAAPPPQAVAAPAQPLGRDIVFIKDAPGRLRPRGAAIYRSAWFVAAQLAPVLLFAAVWGYVRRRERLAADPRLVRFRQAGREVRRALAQLQSDGAGAQFYDALSGAILAYLGAKLDLPPGAVDRERVLARLTANGCAEETAERVRALFELVERARYAPSGDAAAERGTALQLATGIVDRLERQRGLDRRIAAALLLAASVAGLLTAAQAQDGGPQAAFFQGNQAYAAGHYADAVHAYEAALASGQESGALHFNLGNALFKDGQLGRAVASYERARRLLPRDPDVQANLQYARDVAGAAEPAPPLWERLVFPFARRAGGGELAVAASLCWIALWLLLTARLLLPRVALGLGRAAAVAAVLYLAVAGSLGLRLAEVDLRESVVVTAAGETPVRFEPSPSGTAHFPVTAGTRLDVAEERAGWLLVRRADGQRGWIPADAVERI